MKSLALLLFSASLWAVDQKLPEPMRPIVELAPANPPEFGADALLRVAEQGGVEDKDTLRGLIHQAFELGGRAQWRVRMRALPGSEVDTHSGYLSNAYALGLDSLTLQSRAVRDMTAVDPKLAREMFGQIVRPTLEPLTCASSLVYDLHVYYDALEQVLKKGFTAAERKKDQDLNLLGDAIAQVTNPVQLGPLAKLIKSAPLTAAQREIAIARFNGTMESLHADDRSFSVALSNLRGEITPETRDAYEKFLNTQLTGVRCEDNQNIRIGLGGQADQAAKFEGSAKIERYWESAEAKSILEKGRSLRFGPNGNALTDQQRATEDWQQHLTDYLKDLADWKPSSEKTEADYFHQKSVVYEGLLELAPPGPTHDAILADWIRFMLNANLQQQSPVEWMMHVYSVVSRIQNAGAAEISKTLAALRESGSPMLILYANLSRVLTPALPAYVTNGVEER